jgi:hypothetical protein
MFVTSYKKGFLPMDQESINTNKKRSQSELLFIRQDIISRLSEGQSHRSILQYLSSEYKVCERTCYLWVRSAYKDIRESLSESEYDLSVTLYLRYEDLYQKALNGGDLSECRRILSDMSKLVRFDSVNNWVGSGLPSTLTVEYV